MWKFRTGQLNHAFIRGMSFGIMPDVQLGSCIVFVSQVGSPHPAIETVKKHALNPLIQHLQQTLRNQMQPPQPFSKEGFGWRVWYGRPCRGRAWHVSCAQSQPRWRHPERAQSHAPGHGRCPATTRRACWGGSGPRPQRRGSRLCLSAARPQHTRIHPSGSATTTLAAQVLSMQAPGCQGQQAAPYNPHGSSGNKYFTTGDPHRLRQIGQ